MNKKIEDLFCLSVSSRAGDPAPLREKLSILATYEKGILSQWKEKLHEEHPEASVVYLSTCHRVELYAHGVPPGKILTLWEELSGDAVYSLKLFKGEEAQRHLIRVAASLDSEVLGETQITGQVKKSVIQSKSLGFLSGFLDRAFQHAFSATKKIRSLTEIGKGTISVAHVSVDGLSDFFESFSNKKALVIGSGVMAQIALERLLKNNIQEVTWINRTRENIANHELAKKCKIGDYQDRHKLCWEHSIIVSAVRSPQPIIHLDALQNCKKALSNDSLALAPRVFLDLGLPRNIEEEVHGVGGFFLRNVDEFKDRASGNSRYRSQSLDHAERILEEELKKFLSNTENWARGPLISQFIQVVEELKGKTLDELELENDEKIGYIIEAVFSKMTHRVLAEVNGLDE